MLNEELTIRPIRREEQAAALDLWCTVFRDDRSYFGRYYDADPYYREGDTLGAWTDDSQLVSAVHICRRSLIWSLGRTLVCGAIANVATLSDYRGRSLSGRLLDAAVAQMHQFGAHFSILWTGNAPHYARAGWDPIAVPTANLALSADVLSQLGQSLVAAEATSQVIDLYEAAARSLQLVRSADYFATWINRRWRASNAEMLLVEGKGYAVVNKGRNGDGSISATLIELRAINAGAEHEVILQALAAISRDTSVVRLTALPQFTHIADLRPTANAVSTTDSGTMIRNVSLDPSEYASVVAEYSSGRANWWQTDQV